MQVLRIVAEGVTTSFRYPHFMLGVQPTYPMPPPSTIFGHICSALGKWIEPDEVQFAYHFTHDGEFNDLEHIHLVSGASGRSKFEIKGVKYPKVLDGNINPYQREQLFRPQLTLYLNRIDWLEAFRSPRYAVVLGRSQDLMNYTDVRVVDLAQSNQAYVRNMLLPSKMGIQVMRGFTLTMPRWVDYENGRQAHFGQYIALGSDGVVLPVKDEMQFEGSESEPFWIDPEAPMWRESSRAVVCHRFTGG